MSDVQIHPTAIVDPRAEISAGTTIGPYCVIAADVVLGQNCWLQQHVTLCGPMKAGARNKFYASCSIGQQTQDLKYQGDRLIWKSETKIHFVNLSQSVAAKRAKGKRASGPVAPFSPIATSRTIAWSEMTLFFLTTARWPAMWRSAITP